MISKQAVEDQLTRIGCNFRFWGRSEVNELGRILLDDEVIAQCVNGEYSNGFAMLVATNHRVLLVDKKPLLYLTVEDLRYEMITEFNLSHRMLNASIRIHTASKTLEFSSWNQRRLRLLLECIQSRVLEMRNHQQLANQFQAAAAAQYVQQAQMAASQQTAALYQQPLPGNPAAAFFPSPAQPLPQATVQPVVPVQPIPAPATTPKAEAPAADIVQQPAPASTQPDQQTIASRFASHRAALGTYTRSKLPSIRLRSVGYGPQPHQEDRQAESGEVFQDGYKPQPNMGNYQMPYTYE